MFGTWLEGWGASASRWMNEGKLQAFQSENTEHEMIVRTRKQRPPPHTCAVLNAGDGLAVRVVQGHHRKGVWGVLQGEQRENRKGSAEGRRSVGIRPAPQAATAAASSLAHKAARLASRLVHFLSVTVSTPLASRLGVRLIVSCRRGRGRARARVVALGHWAWTRHSGTSGAAVTTTHGAACSRKRVCSRPSARASAACHTNTSPCGGCWSPLWCLHRLWRLAWGWA